MLDDVDTSPDSGSPQSRPTSARGELAELESGVRPRFLNQRVVFSRLPRELGTADTGDFRDMSHNVTKTSSGMLTGNENPDLLMTKL